VPELDCYSPRIETMSAKETRQIQEAKLLKQIRYVYDRSPFYREKFDRAGVEPRDIRGLADLPRIPFTTKEELRDSQIACPPLGRHMAADMDDVIRIHSSTGTTGRPSYVGITRHDHAVWTDLTARSMYAMGVRRPDILIHATSLSLFVGGLPIKEAIEQIGAAFVPIGTGASEKLVSALQVLKANALHATPSYAIYLAEYVKSRFGLHPSELGIRKIVTGAEPGAGIPSIRQRIESEWGARICEGMGNADMAPVIFGECHTQSGMHFCAQEYVIPEVIDPNTAESLPLEKGVVGELVYTSIDRECVPLLRFRTRDRVEICGDGCTCGRTTFRLRCIGRTDDMLILLGVNVFPMAIKDVVSSLRPRTTGEIQVVLDKPGPKVDPPLHVVVEYGQEEQELSQLRQEVEYLLKSRLSIPASVELVPPETLPRFEMKAQLVRKRYEERP